MPREREILNNAGVTSMVRCDMLDLTPGSFDRRIGVNLRGTFFLTKTGARYAGEARPRIGIAIAAS